MAKARGLSGVEITPVNGDASEGGNGKEVPNFIADLQKKSAAKKESKLDNLGFMQKRKLADGTTEDKSKKKKRLDDIMFGLGAAKGVALEKDEVPPGSSLLKSKEGTPGKPDLSKLQDLLGRPDSPSEAKVQKWLEAQMGVVPERPVTPSTSNSTGNVQFLSTS